MVINHVHQRTMTLRHLLQDLRVGLTLIRGSRDLTNMRERFSFYKSSFGIVNDVVHFRPMEVSSKKPVSRRRTVVDTLKIVC